MNRTMQIMALCVFAALCCRAEPPSCFEVLLATSNQWGTAVRAHRASVYDAVSGISTNECGGLCLRQWYESMAAYPTAAISTPSGRLWKMEQASLLLMYGENKFVGSSTNCWLAASDCMGRLRGLERPGLEAEILQFAGSNATNANQEAYLLQMEAYDDMREEQRLLGMIEANVLRVVTNSFPRQIFPLLPVQQCHELSSNVVSRAQLNTEETAVIEGLANCIGQTMQE